jgi:hypothetical protein
MRTHHFHSLFAGVFGLLLIAMPVQLLAHAAGGALKKIAEQLGLQWVPVTREPQAGDRLVLRVVNPEKLAAYGLRDVRANTEVEVTILSEEQVSVAPATQADPKQRVAADAPRLVVVADDKGAIARTQIVRGEVRGEILDPSPGQFGAEAPRPAPRR